MAKSNYLLIKCTGGATAQLLALGNSIYLSNKLNKSFKIKYYPYSTGTYWNFEIKNLLANTEILNDGVTRGLSSTDFISGQYIPDFPLRRSNFSYERLLQVIHKLRLDVPLRRLRREIVVGGKRKNLDRVKSNTLTVSGNFVPLFDNGVFSELSKRFSQAEIPNPFDKPEIKNEVVIHYRLGDMRKMPARDKEMGGHGIVDPETFKEILELVKFDFKKNTIRLVSDEPEIAIKVLKSIGIVTDTADVKPSLWQDLRTIASAKVFIGSMSQFSFFGAMLCAYHGGLSYIPSKIYGEGNIKDNLKIEQFKFFDYKYLPQEHYLFHDIL
jgi:hypothetical protein